ncbi:hypothetical protein BH18VER1_BH18VER1_00860 [soil metagenome]
MWFGGIYSIGSALAISAVAAGFGEPSLRGVPLTREEWLHVAAPLLGAISLLMGLTSVGLRRHQPWARWTFICIWPLILGAGVAAASTASIPWWLGRQAAMYASAIGLLSAWLLFWKRSTVLYFYRIRQASGGRWFRR